MTAICQAGSRNKGKTKTDVDTEKKRGTQRKMDEKTNKWMMTMSMLMLKTEKALGAYKHRRGTVFPVESGTD